MVNLTTPWGVTESEALTVAVKLIGCPNGEGLADDVTLVVVLARWTKVTVTWPLPDRVPNRY
jgi:hypothetical protein